MKTYKQRLKSRKYYVLIKGTDVQGVFRSLKKACDYLKGEKFPSYWTLVRKEFERYDHNGYSLQVVKYN